ncbi:MAG TPA: HAMP domain-containing sensor histidine kinase [Labilithrix sp.]|nr:HAMP domain-containing sensor histidine kinase [Labilithrix sp.]
MARRNAVPRTSLRTNAVLMVLAMLILPQALVIGWSAMERDIGGKLQWSARETAKDAEAALWSAHADGLDGPQTEERLAEVATRHTARIRVVRKDGSERLDVDRDQGTDFIHGIGTWFFGPDGAPTLREFDETLGPVPRRPEIEKVTHWEIAGPPLPSPLPEGSAHRYPIGAVRSATPGGPAPVSTLFASPAAAPPAEADLDTGCRTSPAGKLLVCHATRAVTIGDTTEVIYVQESSRRAVRALYDLRYQLLRLSLIMLPLALGFSWWMGRRMVRPIEWLRERVLEKARSANPRADLDPRPGDEVAELADAFNGLLGSLDDRRRANEAFVADLVHEFKNPVAAIRTCAESLDAGAVDEKRAARLARILADSSSRLDALVSQFLELARAEAGMPNEARGPVDLAALARGVTSAIEEGHPDVRFILDADDATTINGVEPRLDSLLRNLVDNAASFAGAGGEVRVSVKRSPEGAGTVVLEVSDTGPGISDKDLPRMFERFFTTRAIGGSSEPSARKQKGTGLGLALVKAVAEAHGGNVVAFASPGAGATFRVQLPLT